MTVTQLTFSGSPLLGLVLLACSTDATAPPLELAAAYTHVPVMDKELVITDIAVVNDPVRARWKNDGSHDRDASGGWTFTRLMDNLSPKDKPTSAQRTAWTMAWLKTWEVDQVVNGLVIPARPLMRTLVIDPWRADSGCAPDTAPLGTIANDGCLLDFTRAPFRLLAIVNRPDLRIIPARNEDGLAGQGRFVFGVLGKNADGTERTLPFTVIFEYQLPIDTWDDIPKWAERWHKLGERTSFNEDYRKKLFEVTREFTKADPLGRETPNGSAILQIRTNEVPLSPSTPKLWEMREYVLSPAGDRLVATTIKQEPDVSWNDTPELGAWLNDNASEILDGSYVVPDLLDGAPFLAGSTIYGGVAGPTFTWGAPGVAAPVRAAFAAGTCSGCHLSETGGVTGTNFTHIKPRALSGVAQLSPLLAADLAGPRKADFTEILQATKPDDVKDGKGKDHGNERRGRR